MHQTCQNGELRPVGDADDLVRCPSRFNVLFTKRLV